jgi:outer membrane receptor protein involved in Fe transport
VNLFLNIEGRNDWTLNVVANNVLNDEYWTSAASGLRQRAGLFLDVNPRVLSVTLSKHF